MLSSFQKKVLFVSLMGAFSAAYADDGHPRPRPDTTVVKNSLSNSTDISYTNHVRDNVDINLVFNPDLDLDPKALVDASVSAPQKLLNNTLHLKDDPNTATTSGSITGVSGNVGVNNAAGFYNQQGNNAALAHGNSGTTGFRSSSSSGSESASHASAQSSSDTNSRSGSIVTTNDSASSDSSNSSNSRSNSGFRSSSSNSSNSNNSSKNTSASTQDTSQSAHANSNAANTATANDSNSSQTSSVDIDITGTISTPGVQEQFTIDTDSTNSSNSSTSNTGSTSHTSSASGSTSSDKTSNATTGETHSSSNANAAASRDDWRSASSNSSSHSHSQSSSRNTSEAWAHTSARSQSSSSSYSRTASWDNQFYQPLGAAVNATVGYEQNSTGNHYTLDDPLRHTDGKDHGWGSWNGWGRHGHHRSLDNTASMSDSIHNVTGNVGVNTVAGIGNQQENDLALANTAEYSVLASATAGGFQIIRGNTIRTNGPINNTSTMSSAINGVSGNVGVNVAAGVSNQQINALSVAASSR